MAIKESNKRVYITIDKELLEEIKAKAKEEDRTVSNYIAYIMKKEIKK
ncbi:ribbon-helix-helix domain-containing protein [Romboutsia sp.]|nr:hypothetical protein [Romboutsia sp.]HSQ90533.1 hypothetical protein [Romboutsia sp.]